MNNPKCTCRPEDEEHADNCPWWISTHPPRKPSSDLAAADPTALAERLETAERERDAGLVRIEALERELAVVGGGQALTWLRNEHAKLIRKVDALEALRNHVRGLAITPERVKLLEDYEAAVRG